MFCPPKNYTHLRLFHVTYTGGINCSAFSPLLHQNMHALEMLGSNAVTTTAYPTFPGICYLSCKAADLCTTGCACQISNCKNDYSSSWARPGCSSALAITRQTIRNGTCVKPLHNSTMGEGIELHVHIQ